MSKKLTPRQLRFIDEFMVSGCATDAYQRAGFKGKAVHALSHQMKNRPEVKREIERRQAELSRASQVTAENVVAEAAKIAFANIKDYMTTDPEDGSRFLDIDGLRRDQAAAISDIYCETTTGPDGKTVTRTKVKLYDKQKALDMLSKFLGLYQPQRHELSGPFGRPIEVEEVPALEVARRYAFLLEKAAAEEVTDGGS